MPDFYSDKYAKIVETAIRSHSCFRLDESLDEETLMFCNIIRDADKIDIFKVNIDTPVEEIYNVTTKDLKNSEITPEVMQAFDERHAVLRSLKRRRLIMLPDTLHFAFELVYPISLKITKEQGYLDEMMDFKSDNTHTNDQFKQIRRKIDEYVQNKNR